ncbi:zinc-binding dehydrogenase [Streptomyces griseoluteus]|uniref:zinc-binding dehydrogenase n=1 Tax=Streptomyces griseoluteus TaxID=29306 RepID=UPI0037F19640
MLTVHRADVMRRYGLHPLQPGTSPYPGLEVSGRVSALGEGVTGWQVGDERLPMSQAAEAHRLMEAGGHVGKILLVNA